MPAKRKLSDADPPPAVPPSLPPSVEEAYRRKCVQLKNRTNEVEDANDAARLRLARIKRQVEKLRIERAFLLEQLAKRTSANVEDSEGSPSPPPTPKDKPLRIKRGHRKSAANDPDPKAGTANSSKDPGSPASESQSQRPESQPKAGKVASANGVSKSSGPATSAFELYCRDVRPVLEAKNGSGDVNVDEELARGWEELPEADKDELRAKLDEQAKEHRDKGSKEPEESSKKERKSSGGSAKPEPQDDDVEMIQYDTEDQETQMDKDGED
ncbi:High mobility group, HMG1/HMG2 [Hirsutella rhossiliensis]|uniref:High mobility group, HMG1/HMG2 n=1 Tax=Hirsutella rhossiliensis TaxID=111463 RepID=A0A9P8SJF4_9HYPO|nr:High mobility group, HMG1/HMG2 [Hirsutella rhossiliensis]KAH0962991.1 High mobility group, HMG1/HMG2 [Hirsutella rhossiliensis]